MNYSIAIDGPSGVGKSTLARTLAQELQITYVDTGAMYRGIAYFALERGLTENLPGLLRALEDVRLTFEEGKLSLNGQILDQELRTPEATYWSSALSKIPEIRSYLLEFQQSLAKEKDVVMEGRDIGTVVLPNADVKFFLTASLDTRAERRMAQMREEGKEFDPVDIKKEMSARDQRDENRETAPLKPAPDAIHLSSEDKTIEEMIVIMKQYIEEKIHVL